jgi:cell wall-associated NlpC family hydrolase
VPQPSVYDFIPTIESQRGDRYVFGAKGRFSDPNPHAFDCSGLVTWSLARIGLVVPDGAANQFRYCQSHHTIIPVAQGVVTWGALLFRITPPHNHVAVSLGNGQTFEARGAAYGVNTFEALGRNWTAAALIPGLDYSQHHPPKEDDVTADQDRKLASAEAQAHEANVRAANAEAWARLIALKLGITDDQLIAASEKNRPGR